MAFRSVKLELFLKAEGESWEKRQKQMKTDFGRCCFPLPTDSHLIPKRQHACFFLGDTAALRAFHLSCSYRAPKHSSTTLISIPDTPEKKIITGLIPDVVIEKGHTEVTSSATQLIARSGQRRTINQRS